MILSLPEPPLTLFFIQTVYMETLLIIARLERGGGEERNSFFNKGKEIVKD